MFKKIFITGLALLILGIGLYTFANFNLPTLLDNVKGFRKHDIHLIIKHGEAEKLKEYLKNDPNHNLAAGIPLQEAIYWWHSIKLPDRSFSKPQLENAKRTAYEMVKLLIEHGADINQGDGFTTPLESALSLDMQEVFVLLLQNGAKVNIVSPFHPPILYQALGCDDDQYFNLLFKYGANINIQDNSGNSILHLAIRDDLDCNEVKILLTGKNFDFNIKSNENETPLNFAIKKQRLKYVRWLQNEHGDNKTSL